MKTTLYVYNLKCDYCIAVIIDNLSKLNHISNISIKRQYATVTFEHKKAKDVDLVKKTLSKIGYPPFGEKNNFTKKAKPHLSYAVTHNRK